MQTKIRHIRVTREVTTRKKKIKASKKGKERKTKMTRIGNATIKEQ